MANNIKLAKQNFVVVGGYFYTFDEAQDALLQKTDDGNTAFSYPLDTLLTGQVYSLEHDGVDFWTLQDGNTNEVVIKRWRIDNYVCKLQETFTFSPDASHNYVVDTFTLAHYHTYFTTTASGGSSSIYIDKYSDSPDIIEGATLYLGPNSNGESEEVVVSGTIFGGVNITPNTTYTYSDGDPIHFHTHLWLFNNYNGTDSSTGALYKFDSHTGAYLTKYAGGQYKNITASTFYTIPSFVEYGPVDSLTYIKGTNALFVDVSENYANIQDASDLNDSFTGHLVPPNPSRWDLREGSPQLKTNSLFLTADTGAQSITSAYVLRGNFEATIDGTLGTHPTYSGTEHFIHSFGLLFPNESDRYCYIARANNTETDEYPGQENFHTLYNKTTTNVLDITTSGIDAITSYSFKISRAASDISFYYKTTVTGTWDFLGSVEMFSSDCKLLLSLDNSIGSTTDTTFDNLEFLSGNAVYFSTATSLPFYGSMVMENIQSDLVTVIPVYDLSIDSDNMYRLQNIEDGGGSMSGYNYQLSPLDSFVTSISLSASPAIIAANGLSTSTISAVVKDQFLQPIVGRRVTFSENGSGSITGGTQINTDSEGQAATVYTAGTTAQEVTLTAVVEQTN